MIERVVPERVRIGGRIVRNAISPIGAILAVYLTWTFGTAYAHKVEFDDDLQKIARASAYNDDSTSAIREQIMQRAREIGIPVREENVGVVRDEDSVRINANYDIAVNLIGGKVVTLSFAPSYVEKGSTDAAIQVKKLQGNK